MPAVVPAPRGSSPTLHGMWRWCQDSVGVGVTCAHPLLSLPQLRGHCFLLGDALRYAGAVWQDGHSARQRRCTPAGS